MDAVIGMGANLGNRQATLAHAVDALRALGAVTAISRLYETAPIGPPQPPFLNAAARISTALSPLLLLEALLRIERAHGRVRVERWGPRTLDLDILWISGTVVAAPALTIPHPRLKERRFALLPLLDVAPDACHPASGEPVRQWVDSLPDVGVHVAAAAGWDFECPRGRAPDGVLPKPP